MTRVSRLLCGTKSPKTVSARVFCGGGCAVARADRLSTFDRSIIYCRCHCVQIWKQLRKPSIVAHALSESRVEVRAPNLEAFVEEPILFLNSLLHTSASNISTGIIIPISEVGISSADSHYFHAAASFFPISPCSSAKKNRHSSAAQNEFGECKTKLRKHLQITTRHTEIDSKLLFTQLGPLQPCFAPFAARSALSQLNIIIYGTYRTIKQYEAQ